MDDLADLDDLVRLISIPPHLGLGNNIRSLDAKDDGRDTEENDLEINKEGVDTKTDDLDTEAASGWVTVQVLSPQHPYINLVQHSVYRAILHQQSAFQRLPRILHAYFPREVAISHTLLQMVRVRVYRCIQPEAALPIHKTVFDAAIAIFKLLEKAIEESSIASVTLRIADLRSSSLEERVNAELARVIKTGVIEWGWLMQRHWYHVDAPDFKMEPWEETLIDVEGSEYEDAEDPEEPEASTSIFTRIPVLERGDEED